MISLERRSLKILVKYSTGLDKKGQPDLFRPISVERMITEIYYNLNPTDLTVLRCTALLHDIVEDEYLTLGELREELEKDRHFLTLNQFHKIDRIIEYVDILTHRKGERYIDYIERVCQNPFTAWVKRTDILHNTSATRINGLDQPTIDRLVIKYSNALEIIDKKCGSMIQMPTLSEIRRLTQELRILESFHSELNDELHRVLNKGQGENFKIVWVYDRDPGYPNANLYIVCSEDKKFIQDLEFGISNDGIFSKFDEFKYYNSDGARLETSDEIYVTMMDFSDWRNEITPEGKMKQVKIVKEDVKHVIPVRIKGKILNIVEVK